MKGIREIVGPVLVLLCACSNSTSGVRELEYKLTKISTGKLYNPSVSVSVNNDTLVIRLVDEQPFFVNYDARDSFVSYYLYESRELLEKAENVRVICSLQDSQRPEPFEILYTRQKLNRTFNTYDEVPQFISFVEHMLANFSHEEFFAYDVALLTLETKVESLGFNASFMALLFEFSRDCQRRELSSRSGMLMYRLAVYLSFPKARGNLDHLNYILSECDYPIVRRHGADEQSLEFLSEHNIKKLIGHGNTN